MKSKEAVIIGILTGVSFALLVRAKLYDTLFQKEHELLNQSIDNNSKLIGILMDAYGYTPEQKAVLTQDDFIRVSK